MTPEQAADIIEQLALGTDPRDGNPLADSDSCTAPEVIRALFLARTALRGALAAPAPAKTPRAPVMRNGVVLPNVGKKWSGDDVDTLLRQFEAGTPIGAIAAQLGRTDSGIVARLVHAGAIPDRETGYALMREGRQKGG
ncbi:hypothetical protein IP92_02118 [Pseudoduganella flava]|uniref:Uncharacterized protein n=1 Tax=Pseudoduganella flava TaxID=871742 RepID=A0A562PWC6_9BURK|nr:hypothetical protein [Pseudoduganella flava]QGZ39806.1 hypothetical protein GO485_12590 [Pseudoduganella flava]TWI48725.1 hypothetical protein IP92_02118 [Pseudoduganella flava]